MNTHKLNGLLIQPALVLCIFSIILAPLLIDQASAESRALIVAIENYPKGIKKLRGVSDDAKLMKEALTKVKLFSEPQIRTLVDKEATKSNIVGEFRSWLINDSKPGDTVLFYFSGHGAQVWDKGNDEVQDGLDEVLICHDAKFQARKVRRSFRGRYSAAFEPNDTKNLLLDDEISDLLKQLKGRKVIFISDSCHSGSVYKRLDEDFVLNKTLEQPESYKSVFEIEYSKPGEKAVGRNNIGDDLALDDLELAAFTASADAQPAQVKVFKVDPTGFHSVFTWHLYHALLGKADQDKDGQVTFQELAKFVQENIESGSLAGEPGGYAQIPQYLFIPKNISSLTIGPSKPDQEDFINKPNKLICAFGTKGLSNSEESVLKKALQKSVPALSLTSDVKKAQGRIKVEKRGAKYGARLSDSSGSYWESIQGSSLDEVAQGLIGNVRALYIHHNLATLTNHGAKNEFSLQWGLVKDNPRPPKTAYGGDRIKFKIKNKTSGHVYIFNVDAAGVIHPLLPGPDGASKPMAAGQELVLGEDRSLVVGVPYGKDMFFAMKFDQIPDSLKDFWAKDNIGKADSLSFDDQQAFLNTIWSLFTGSDKGKKGSSSQMIVFRSMEKEGSND